ncbi:MAG: hypothetical protein ACKV2V_02040 [Blastocatellia bacterium]
MLKTILCQFLIITLVSGLVYGGTPGPRKVQQPATPEIFKKFVVEHGTNTQVNVRLKSGEKLKGRIADINDEFFALQFVEKGKISTREIRYDDLKTLSEKSNAGNIATGIAVGALAAAGVVMTVLLIAILGS